MFEKKKSQFCLREKCTKLCFVTNCVISGVRVSLGKICDILTDSGDFLEILLTLSL